MTADLRVLSLWQPWATLLADPALPKRIETRPLPIPSTMPLPVWVLIQAAAKRPEHLSRVGEWSVHMQPFAEEGPEIRRLGAVKLHTGLLEPKRFEYGLAAPLPFGAVVGAVRYDACLPMHDTCTEPIPDDLIYQTAGGGGLYRQRVIGNPFEASGVLDQDITDQLPYGDFRAGRWAYLAGECRLLPQPIAYRGGQGWRRATPELVAQVTEQIGALDES